MKDVIFKPGAKVMRVGSESSPTRTAPIQTRVPQFGEILCVSECWKVEGGYQCMFAGFGGPYYFNGLKTGWRTRNFREVEEIRLCLSAVRDHPMKVDPVLTETTHG